MPTDLVDAELTQLMELANFAPYDWMKVRPAVVRSLVAEVIRLRERTGWRDIATAPKDGTAILVMQNNWPGCKNGVAEDCNGHNTYVAAFWSNEDDGNGRWICYMGAVLDPECPIEITHWRPLPEPPQGA